MLRVMTREPLAWTLSAFYFLTFGGFVAFAVYLPTLLKDQFGLSPAQAGFRAAGFVILATGMRPVGRWLADRIGGARVLSVVFAGIVPFALILSWPAMVPFTVGALGCAALLGLGNGAVFKLVPQHFPQSTGTVGGLVGAIGGLGGFFPPLLLGFFRDNLGVLWPGYALLAATSLALAVVNQRVFLASDPVRVPARLRAGVWASLWTGLLAASIVIGSRNLQNFDAALVVYTFAVVFAAWGVLFHYFVWITKPPRRCSGGGAGSSHGPAAGGRPWWGLIPSAFNQLIAQGFIRRRSVLRWWMHQCLFWGCLLGVAVTFPSCSAGCTSARLRETPRPTWRSSSVSVPSRSRSGPSLRGWCSTRSTFRRSSCSPESRSHFGGGCGPGGAGPPDVPDGLRPSPPALCGVRHRARPHGVHALVTRGLLPFSLAPACGVRHRAGCCSSRSGSSSTSFSVPPSSE